jgi:hypothetical protein
MLKINDLFKKNKFLVILQFQEKIFVLLMQNIVNKHLMNLFSHLLMLTTRNKYKEFMIDLYFKDK